MPIRIESYSEEHIPAVLAFNERAKANNALFVLSKSPVAGWLPAGVGKRVWREFFLALDGAEVRGGFTLRRQAFRMHGGERAVANYQGPLSEGQWDRRFMMAGVQLLRGALRVEPLLYALGMGGLEQPMPRQLASAGWSLALVPFFFRVLNGGRFLQNIGPLRRSAGRRLAADLAAKSGLGWAGFRAVHWVKNNAAGLAARCTAEPATGWGAWADEVWSRAGAFIGALRDAGTMSDVFPGTDKNLIVRCRRGGADIGWAVVRCTAMSGDKYFGDLVLGSLVDCLAVPGEEATVAELAVRFLAERGADLVVTNQSHAVWRGALHRAGWLAGPSNFTLGLSPDFAALAGPLEKSLGDFHITRADGDGPIHL